MGNVHVDLGTKSYDIEIERGLLEKVGKKVKALLPKAEKAAVITDSNVGPLYADVLRRSLEREGLAVTVLTFKAGEQESYNLGKLVRWSGRGRTDPERYGRGSGWRCNR